MAVTRTKQRAIPLAAVAILLLTGCSSSSGARTPSPSGSSSSSRSGRATPTPCAQSWDLRDALVPSGDAAADTQLASVAAVSPTDVWAVGSTAATGKALLTLAEHWNGSSWSIVRIPDAGNAATLGGDELTAITAVSASDVWAVGYVGTPSISYSATGQPESTAVQTLTEHWDGTAWSIVNAPDVAARDGVEPWDVLTSVAAISADDVWAVGVTEWPLTYGSLAAAQPLVEHWNGTYWATITVPDPEPAPPDWALTEDGTPPSSTATAGSVALLSVTAGSASDVWLVGGYEADMGLQNYRPGPWKTLTEHWDGTSWSVVPAPDATLSEPLSGGSTEPDDLLTAAGESPRGDLWAVGGALPGSALTLHLGAGFGTAGFAGWQLVPSLAVTAKGVTWPGNWPPESYPPSFFSDTSPLVGIVTLSASDAWAVGAVILHWDGTSWQPLYTVNGRSFDFLTGVAATGSGDLWAVGGTSIVHATCI